MPLSSKAPQSVKARSLLLARLSLTMFPRTPWSLVFLLGTAAIAATIGGLTAMSFHLTAEGIAIGESEAYTTHSLQDQAGNMGLLEDTIVGIIPENPFYAMTGQGPNATLSVVLIACLVGAGIIGVRTYEPEQAELFAGWINALNTLVVEIVMMIIMLTPYGIFSLMTFKTLPIS